MFDMVVIGGGPAALAAMHYAHNKQLTAVMLYEAMGGKVAWLQQQAGAPSPRSVAGTELLVPLLSWIRCQKDIVLQDRVRAVTERASSLEGFDIITDRHGTLHTTTVVIATGASPLYLHVPGAARLLDKGLHYSITTHAASSTGKAVAVVGVTPRSLRGAAELVRTAGHVYVIADDPAKLATPLGRSLRAQSNVEVLEHCQVREVIGVHSVETLFVECDGQGRRLNVQQVFVDLELTPRSELVQGLVTTDAGGFIRVDQHNATSVAGIFAAGDVTTAIGEQITIAVGDGARAAQSGYDFVLARDLARHVRQPQVVG